MKKSQKMVLTGFAVFVLLITGAVGFWYYWFIADVNPNAYGLNPLHKHASILESGEPKFSPIPDDALEFYHSDNYSLSSVHFDFATENPWKASKRIKSEADVIVYATVKEIRPAVDTSPVSTPIIFEIIHVVKGNVSDELIVQIPGGYTQKSGYWQDGRGLVKPWDFADEESYLLYLKTPESYDSVFGTDYYVYVHRGIFILDKPLENADSVGSNISESSDSGSFLPSEYYDIPASLNPLNKNITPFVSSGCSIVPRSDDLIWYQTWSNYSRVGYNYDTLMEECDAAFYGTVKEIQPSAWSTSSGKEPLSLSTARPGKGKFGDETGSYEYNLVRVTGLDEIIYTSVVFDVDSWVKKPGNISGAQFTVEVEGGQVGKYVMPGSFYPNVWDLKEGDSYLVYIKYQNVMHPGLFVVLD